MARYTGSSCKKCRKLDTKLFLKGTKCFTKCVADKKAAPTKRGGSKPRSKASEYALHLREKQKARIMAGMTEQPFANLFHKASKAPGQTGEHFIRLLETRLDNIVRRTGFAVSLKTARQLVLHGHVKVNDRMVNVPSFQIKVGDVVKLAPKVAEIPAVKQGLEEASKRSLRPSFIEYNPQTNTGKLLRWPDRGEMSYPMQDQLIVEYYSK